MEGVPLEEGPLAAAEGDSSEEAPLAERAVPEAALAAVLSGEAAAGAAASAAAPSGAAEDAGEAASGADAADNHEIKGGTAH